MESSLVPAGEWSGDLGCGVQYFSRQGVNPLAQPAGFEFPEEMGLPERLMAEQIELLMPDEKMKRHGQAVAAARLPDLGDL